MYVYAILCLGKFSYVLLSLRHFKKNSKFMRALWGFPICLLQFVNDLKLQRKLAIGWLGKEFKYNKMYKVIIKILEVLIEIRNNVERN